MADDAANLDVVWGAEEIARTIKRTRRATYHMLESGALPGSRKIGDRWAFSPRVFADAMREGAAA